MNNTAKIQFTELENSAKSAIQTLLYFDIFSYPLRAEEILNFQCNSDSDVNETSRILEHLVEEEFIFKLGEYYSLNNETALLERRLKGNEKADAMMKKAKWVSAFIGNFPFVRCVCISGSLSKGYFDAASDIDYFIITEPNRLWIARTFLVAFKKIFLLNSKKYFCTNYFIDTAHLEIEDKNIFTATEIFTLMPMNNTELFEKFMSSNSWAKDFLPNYGKKITVKKREPNSFIKKIFEKLLSGKFGEWLDTYFLRITLKLWHKDFPYYNPDVFELTMRSRKYVSKHHPQNMQTVILQKFEERIKSFEIKFNVSLQYV